MKVKYGMDQQLEIISRENKGSVVVVEVSPHEIIWLFIELVASGSQDKFSIFFRDLDTPKFKTLPATEYNGVVDDMKKCIDSLAVNYYRYHTFEMEDDDVLVQLETTATDLLIRSRYSYTGNTIYWFRYQQLLLKMIIPPQNPYDFIKVHHEQ